MNVSLETRLGPLSLCNPVMVASGTFGYAKEMEGVCDLSVLGAILPKTVTSQSRAGNRPWRTVETAAGLLNSIGLDNDGLDYFLANHLPYFRTLRPALILSIAGSSHDDFVEMARKVAGHEGIAAVELNVSCPNVAHGVDFGANAELCRRLVQAVREVSRAPIITKLTPNVTSIADIARAARDGGSHILSMINTVLGMAIDWRKRRPLLGNIVGGLSGPAIKPIALRCVYQVRQAVELPIIGIGGISSVDDAMEFFVAGASAIQVGTANYFDPTLATRLPGEIERALGELGMNSLDELVGKLELPSH